MRVKWSVGKLEFWFVNLHFRLRLAPAQAGHCLDAPPQVGGAQAGHCLDAPPQAGHWTLDN